MLKFDKELIKDRFAATSYSFYTDDEIMRLSVKQILNTVSFDHLGKPLSGGIYDKALGVSPFDPRSLCVTCGLDCNFCPGHVGHIELTAPVYNPFLIKHLYKLLKSMCVHCHHLRINPKKVEVFVMSLKLLKAGHVIASQRIKQYFLTAAKEVKLINDSQKEDIKRLEQFKASMDQLLQSKKATGGDKEEDSILHYFHRIEKKFKKIKRKYETSLEDMFKEFTTHKEEDYSAQATHTTIMEKAIKQQIKEIWESIIPISCPHCHAKNPGFRIDGYTKIFRKPISNKLLTQMKQQDRIKQGTSSRQSSRGRNDSTNIDDGQASGFEVQTDASTRKYSQSERSVTINTMNEDESMVHEDEEEEEDDEEEVLTNQQIISPQEVKDLMEKLWRKEKDLLSLIYGRYHPVADGEQYASDTLGEKMFFIHKLIVPPNRFRPESQGGLGGGHGGGDKSFLHAHSAMLVKILNLNLALKDLFLQSARNDSHAHHAAGRTTQTETMQKWIQLQDAINSFMDSSMAQKTADREQPGLRQLLERKEGMFRMKMMGKRVNFGARSVISPDPYITTDQIGVPIFMAKKLTFPESVSHVNVERLRRSVINGPKQHPGANIVEDEETGQRIHLETLSLDQRRGLAYQLSVGRKIVYRHMHSGDVLLVNRQPTLHKPSIMAHIARILPKEQTIRMHYANCNTYNADFDGDEMNLHLCQSYLACSEAYKLMATHRQYIVPTSGKPIRGLIQDSVVSGVFMSSKDTFLTKDQYQQLVYVGLRELLEDGKLNKIITMPPTIIKPRPLWTGKQVVSTLLKNIVNHEGSDYKKNKIQGLNLDSKSKLSAKEWGSIGQEEGDVIFRDNELLQGTLDKNQYGASEFGLVHSFYEIYGSEKAGELLTSLARIFTAFLQMHGFTCGLDDLVLTPEFNKKRRLIIEESHQSGMQAAAKFSDLGDDFKADPLNYSNRIVFQSDRRPRDKDIERFNKQALPANPFEGKKCIQAENPVRSALEAKFNLSEDLQKLDVELDNTMKSKLNEATGKVLKLCVPDGLVKRFPRNNISAMVLTGAKGGLVNMTQICVLLGQQELEGRRVPKMQNGKTLPCYLPYDPNPRSSGYVTDRFISGLRPQDFYFHCMAGREGLIDTAVKTSRSGYLQRCLIKQLESLIVNYDMTVRDNDGSIVQFLYGDDGVDVMNSKYLDRFGFLEQNFTSLITNYNSQEIMSRVDTTQAEAYKHADWKQMKRIKKDNPQMTKQDIIKGYRGDPVISKMHPLRYFGSISEKIDDQLKAYIEKESGYTKREMEGQSAPKAKYLPVKGETFQKMYYLKYMKSVAHPGENVGTIAGQSIGEPSTQMTLNTFHLAGHGAENMTLGIPRLKEILMTTPTDIKTPNMMVYFQKSALEKMSRDEMETFAYKFKRIRLSDVTKEVKVSQFIHPDPSGEGFNRVYRVTLLFEPIDRIKKFLGLSFNDLIKVFQDKFATLLLSEISKQIKKGGQAATSATTPSEEKKSKPKRGGKSQQQSSEAASAHHSEVEMIEEEEKLVSGKKQKKKTENEGDEGESGEDEGNESDYNSDIDGVHKNAKEMQGYDDIDEDAQEEVQEEQGGKGRTDSQEEGVEVDDNIQHHNIHKEKFSKFATILKGITTENNKSVTMELTYNLSDKKVLMLTLAENLLTKVLVRSVTGIDKCTLVVPDEDKEKSQRKEPYLVVQGLNFDEFYKFADIINVNRIYTNDIYKMGKKYGIEACRANLVNEVRSVFKMYGIEVNYRHLSLIGDFMTFNGEYRAFNRIGMEESSSPFLKMSFETTMKYLVNSCLTKDTDDMSTPSSALVLGQVPRVGTGVFDIIHDPDVTQAL